MASAAILLAVYRQVREVEWLALTKLLVVQVTLCLSACFVLVVTSGAVGGSRCLGFADAWGRFQQSIVIHAHVERHAFEQATIQDRCRRSSDIGWRSIEPLKTGRITSDVVTLLAGGLDAGNSG